MASSEHAHVHACVHWSTSFNCCALNDGLVNERSRFHRQPCAINTFERGVSDGGDNANPCDVHAHKSNWTTHSTGMKIVKLFGEHIIEDGQVGSDQNGRSALHVAIGGAALNTQLCAHRAHFSCPHHARPSLQHKRHRLVPEVCKMSEEQMSAGRRRHAETCEERIA